MLLEGMAHLMVPLDRINSISSFRSGHVMRVPNVSRTQSASRDYNVCMEKRFDVTDVYHRKTLLFYRRNSPIFFNLPSKVWCSHAGGGTPSESK